MNQPYYHVISNKDVINAIAHNLTNLESFTFSTCELLKGEHVNVLVGLPHLKCVTIRGPFCRRRSLKPPEERAVEFVKIFKDCAKLSQLDIDDIDFVDCNVENQSQLFAEAAAMYDRKDFDMFVGGVQYRTW